MKASRFEDILAWQKAKALSVAVYRACRPLKDFGFRSQLERAAVSVMNNIAEGFERRGDKELSHFLFIAKGSCGEVRSMLLLGSDLCYFAPQNLSHLLSLAEETSRLLSGFISSLHQTPLP